MIESVDYKQILKMIENWIEQQFALISRVQYEHSSLIFRRSQKIHKTLRRNSGVFLSS